MYARMTIPNNLSARCGHMEAQWTYVSLLLSFSLLMFFWVTRAYAEPSSDAPIKKLTFVSSRPINHKITRRLILVYTEALKRLNIEFKYLGVPAKRASLYSSQGVVDGELSRVYNYNTRYPNLIRVEEPNHPIKFIAYATDSTILLNGWESLNGTDYMVSCLRGIKLCIENVSRVVSKNRIIEVDKHYQSFMMLLKGRIDVFIDNEARVKEYMDSKEFHFMSQGKTVLRAGIIAETTGHAWLHSKHTTLAPKLAKVLRKMKQEGLYQKLRGWHSKEATP